MQPATIPYIIGITDYYGMTYDEAYKAYYAKETGRVDEFIKYQGAPHTGDEARYKTADKYIEHLWNDVNLNAEEYEFAKESISYFLNPDNDEISRTSAYFLGLTMYVSRKEQDLARS